MLYRKQGREITNTASFILDFGLNVISQHTMARLMS
jgi:hypothetical protein